MKLKNPGRNISKIEVLNISPFGIWILVKAKEFFLPYKDFPWFRDKMLAQIQNVELHHQDHLYWPALDIDLHVDSLTDLEKYSIIYH